MKNILYLFFLLLLPVLGFGQSRYGVEGVPMCWTISGKDSSIVRYVLISSTGKPVKTVAYENAQGAVINVSGGVLRYGFCDCAGGLDSLTNASVTWAKLAQAVKDSIKQKRDTFITVPINSNYVANLSIDNPAKSYNNVYISAKGRTDTSIIAFLGIPVVAEQKGVVYNIKCDSGLVAAAVFTDIHSSNSKTLYLLKKGQTAQVQLLPDQNDIAWGWAVNLVWDSLGVGGGGIATLVYDNYRLPGINYLFPQKGLTANESVANYSYNSINELKYKFNTIPIVSGSTEYGGWLANGTSGDSLCITVPYAVIIGDSQAEGHPAQHGRLHPASNTFDPSRLDVYGQLSFKLGSLTKMRWFNHGIGGQTTSEVWARWRRDVLAETYDPGDGRGSRTLRAGTLPSVVVVIAGINDFYVGGGVSVETVTNNLERMAKSAQDNGIPIVFFNCPGDAVITEKQLRQIDSLNTYFKSGALQAFGSAIFDYNAWWKSSTWGDNKHRGSWIVDEIHPSEAGYDTLATNFFNAVKLPVLDSVVFYSEIGPGSFTGFSRPTFVNIAGVPYSLSNAGRASVGLTSKIVRDSVFIKINSSTSVSGTSTSGFSHVEFRIKNDTTGLVSKRNKGFHNYVGATTLDGSGAENYFTTWSDQNTLIGTFNFRMKGTRNIYWYTGVIDSLTTGSNNFFFGAQSGRWNKSGGNNNAFGSQALTALKTGSNNNAFGLTAGSSLSSGSHNNLFGSRAGFALTTGGNNNFFGENTGNVGTTASDNNAFGSNAMALLTTGAGNNGIGFEAGRGITSGNFNNYVGYQAGRANNTGSDNIGIGTQAGNTITTGTNNVMIGRNTNPTAANSTYQLNIGNILFGVLLDNTKATGILNGRIGIGVDLPNAALHLKAGTSLVSTAPLKFTAGTNLITPESGALEYNGTDFYGTDGSLSRGVFIRGYKGTGSPEGVVTAGVGTIYLRSDGGAGTTLYIKESGAGNTGWVAK
jgi:lysophospholipase L1-like esterase